MTDGIPACVICKHFLGSAETGGVVCTAYPGGIPEPIILGEWSHRQPIPGDGGIYYEVNPDLPADDPLRQHFG